MNEYIVVKTMVPDRDTGEKIAQALLEKRLAACVSVSAVATSMYWWQGEITRDREFQLMIKTRASCYPDLESTILAIHPYEIPEIIAIPLKTGYPRYLDWIAAETD